MDDDSKLLIHHFQRGLDSETNRVLHLHPNGEPKTLSKWFEMAQAYDLQRNRLQQQQRPYPSPYIPNFRQYTSRPRFKPRGNYSKPRFNYPRKPVAVHASNAQTQQPRPERMLGNCYNCGKPGHYIANCTLPRRNDRPFIRNSNTNRSKPNNSNQKRFNQRPRNPRQNINQVSANSDKDNLVNTLLAANVHTFNDAMIEVEQRMGNTSINTLATLPAQDVNFPVLDDDDSSIE